MKRTLVSLPDELFQIIRTKLMGKFGENDSEIIRGIIIAYLSEHGYLKNEDNLSENINMQEDMIGALVDVLKEKWSYEWTRPRHKNEKKIILKTKSYKV